MTSANKISETTSRVSGKQKKKKKDAVLASRHGYKLHLKRTFLKAIFPPKGALCSKPLAFQYKPPTAKTIF